MESTRENQVNADVLEFVIFVVENVAQKLGTSGDVVYRALSRESDLLNAYVIPSYDVLHTQGRDYIVNDVIEAMRRRGVCV